MSGAALTFHHVGIACRRLSRERREMEVLGFRTEGAMFEDPAQRIRGLFMLNGSYRIELLEPLDPSLPSPLDTYLDRGIKLYHHAFLTPDIDSSVADLVAVGAIVSVSPVPSVAFDGRRIAFLMQRTMSLIELIEDVVAENVKVRADFT